MANVVFLAVINLVYVFCLCYAIVSDFRRLIIPNWAPVALASAFVVFAATHLGWRAFLAHLAVAAVVFVLATAFFVARWMGGGDVKLLTAVTLWMGPEHGALFTLLMAALGAVLATGLILIRHYGEFVGPSIWELAFFKRLAELARAGECPYGVAIGIAALLTRPTVLGAG
jgi:prepilin peptidase CpaA